MMIRATTVGLANDLIEKTVKDAERWLQMQEWDSKAFAEIDRLPTSARNRGLLHVRLLLEVIEVLRR